MILIDQESESDLKLSFKFSQTYVDFMKKIKKDVYGMRYDPVRKLWYFPKDRIDVLEKTVGERLIWITPKWKIFGLEKPNYENLYNISLHDLPRLENLTLFKYQEFGVNFMIDRLERHRFAVNCFSVGLGKSIMSIVTQEWMKINKSIKKTILICPKMLKQQWDEEVYKTFTPNENTFIVPAGLVKNKRDKIYTAFGQAGSGTLIVNFHLFLHDAEELKKLIIDYAVVDEAQDIATHDGKINSAVKSVLKKVPYLTILTATPIKSKPDNLYAVFALKDESILGDWKSFDSRYIDYEWTDYGLQKIGYKNLSELKDVVDEYVIRVTEHEVEMELPEVITKIYRIDPDNVQERLLSVIEDNRSEANSLYLSKKLKDDVPDEEKEKLYGRVMLHSQAAKAVSDDPRLIPMSSSGFLRKLYSEYIPKKYTMSTKTELAIELVKEIADSHQKVIIFTEFEREVRLLSHDLQKALKTEPILSVTGETDTDDDVETIQRFKTDPDCKILIGTSALQTGQNLQAASFIIHFDLPQAQDGLQQRRGRARRVGSKFKNIIEYFLVTKNSPEIAKLNRLKIQTRMSNTIFNTDEEQQRILREKSN